MWRVHSLVVGAFEVNCWIVEGDSSQVIVLDPGEDAKRIEDMIRRHHWTVSAWIVTHGHIDHLSALAELADTFPAPVAIHAADAVWAFSSDNAMPPHYGPPREPATIARRLRDGDRFTDAGLEWEVIETPGHSPGSICILFTKHNALFTGDTLFANSVGRTDLPGGSPRAMTASLRRLQQLPGAIDVFPGHGPKTTLERENRSNPYLRRSVAPI